MNAIPQKTSLVDPDKIPAGAEFTKEQAIRALIEKRPTNLAGTYGWRIRLLHDETGDPRLIMAANQYADDFSLAAGVRDERTFVYTDKSDYVSSAGGYTQSQLDAIERVRQAHDTLGPVATSYCIEMIINGVNSRALGKIWNCNHETATARGKKALQRLADHYESPQANRRKKSPKS